MEHLELQPAWSANPAAVFRPNYSEGRPKWNNGVISLEKLSKNLEDMDIAVATQSDSEPGGDRKRPAPEGADVFDSLTDLDRSSTQQYRPPKSLKGFQSISSDEFHSSNADDGASLGGCSLLHLDSISDVALMDLVLDQGELLDEAADLNDSSFMPLRPQPSPQEKDYAACNGRVKEMNEFYCRCRELKVTLTLDPGDERHLYVSNEKSHTEAKGVATYRYPSPEEIKGADNVRKIKDLYRWNYMYNRLVDYRNVHGHCIVPQRPKTSLGNFVMKQRAYMRDQTKGKKSCMTPFRIEALDDIGFDWGKTCGDWLWNNRYDRLVSFKKLHRHCRVPTRKEVQEGWTSEDKRFGRWVSQQRERYRLGLLDEGKRKKLSEIGFKWSFNNGK